MAHSLFGGNTDRMFAVSRYAAAKSLTRNEFVWIALEFGALCVCLPVAPSTPSCHSVKTYWMYTCETYRNIVPTPPPTASQTNRANATGCVFRCAKTANNASHTKHISKTSLMFVIRRPVVLVLWEFRLCGECGDYIHGNVVLCVIVCIVCNVFGVCYSGGGIIYGNRSTCKHYFARVDHCGLHFMFIDPNAKTSRTHRTASNAVPCLLADI